MAKKKKPNSAWWIHRERARRAKWAKAGRLTVRYECPLCGGDHHRNEHERLEEAA